jgi:hypothetical protein
MQNVSMSVEKNELVIRVRLDKDLGLSTSGKSRIVATTSGNVSVPGSEDVKVGLNVYRPNNGSNVVSFRKDDESVYVKPHFRSRRSR